MKKKLAIYFALLSSLFVAVSCSSSEEEQYELSPYAMIKSFRIGNIRSSYPSFTSTGEDTLVLRTVSMERFGFTIDQASGRIYNNDSLPYATNVSRVVTSFSVDGVLSIYVDSLDSYEYMSTTDSIDFTSPRKLRVYAADAQYYKDYTVSVNVHQVEPEMMVWNRYQAVEGVSPVRAVELAGRMYLFGTDADGAPVVAVTAAENEPDWSVSAVSGLPAGADLGTVQLFRDVFYAVADGDVYSSVDGIVWSFASVGAGAAAIIGASDADGKLWIAGEQGIYFSENGSEFTFSESLPVDFPLYGISLASYPLNHNKNIIRYMLVGYANEDKSGEPEVWSRLSTEGKWTNYKNEDNKYACPALKDLSVVRYDDYLYAVGGAGKVSGFDVEAFKSFYISKDNGIAWKTATGFYQRLPKELFGSNAPFAVTVDSNNFMWIINSGSDGAVWKGIINRLGFERK